MFVLPPCLGSQEVIGAPHVSHQERIAREDGPGLVSPGDVGDEKADVLGGVPRRVDDPDPYVPQLQHLGILQGLESQGPGGRGVEVVGASHRTGQLTGTGDVVPGDVGFQHPYDGHLEIPGFATVEIDPHLPGGIDDECDPLPPARQEVGCLM